jgi:hypothetical protein
VAIFFFFIVEMRNGTYSGQNPTRLVTKNMTARIPRMTAHVPLICFVRYKTAITATKTSRMIRSAGPMLIFIHFSFPTRETLILYLKIIPERLGVKKNIGYGALEKSGSYLFPKLE